jgi:hypothetical protein
MQLEISVNMQSKFHGVMAGASVAVSLTNVVISCAGHAGPQTTFLPLSSTCRAAAIPMHYLDAMNQEEDEVIRGNGVSCRLSHGCEQVESVKIRRLNNYIN